MSAHAAAHSVPDASLLMFQADALHSAWMGTNMRLSNMERLALAGMYDAAAVQARRDHQPEWAERSECEAESYRARVRADLMDGKLRGLAKGWRGWFLALATARPDAVASLAETWA